MSVNSPGQVIDMGWSRKKKNRKVHLYVFHGAAVIITCIVQLFNVNMIDKG